MRCKISVQKISSMPIYYDYQYGLASMLYARLAKANISLANQTHNHQGFKFYTFSNLIIEDWIPNNQGLNFNRAHFFITSPNPDFIRSFTEGLLLEPEFFLGKNKKANFIIESIEMQPKHEFSDTCTFRTLSPIYVKTVMENVEKLVEIDLYPKDAKFYENLQTNLASRYEEYSGHVIEQDFFKIIDIKDFKPKRVSIDTSFRRCSLLTMEVQGNPKLLEFAYDAGLGEKNAMGFGCLEIV